MGVATCSVVRRDLLGSYSELLQLAILHRVARDFIAKASNGWRLPVGTILNTVVAQITFFLSASPTG